MTELHYLTVAEASRRIAKGKLSPEIGRAHV